MPSEFAFDAVFIRETGCSRVRFGETIELELRRMFGEWASWHAETKREQGLEIAVVEMKGLSPWSSEDEAIEGLESRMESECWDWLNGYRLRVIPKEDAGPCRCIK